MASSKKPTRPQHANPADGWQSGLQGGGPEEGRPADCTPAEMGDLPPQVDKDLLNGHVNGLAPLHWEWEHVAPHNGVIRATPSGGGGGGGRRKKRAAQRGRKAQSNPASRAPTTPHVPCLRLNGSSSPEAVPELQPVMDAEKRLAFPHVDLPSDSQGTDRALAAGQSRGCGHQDSGSKRQNDVAQHKSRPDPLTGKLGSPCDRNCGACSSLNSTDQDPLPQPSSTSDIYKGARPKVLKKVTPGRDGGRRSRNGPSAPHPTAPNSDPSSHVTSNGCGRTAPKKHHRHQNERHRSSRSSSNHRSSSKGSHGRQRHSQGWRKRGRQGEGSGLPNGVKAAAEDVQDRRKEEEEDQRLSDPVAADEGADMQSPQDSPVSPEQEPGVNGTPGQRHAARLPGSALPNNEEDVPEMVDEGAVCDYDNLVADLSLSNHHDADQDSADSQDLDPPQYYALGPACREPAGNSSLDSSQVFFSSRQHNGGAEASSCDNDALLRFNSSRLGPRPVVDNGRLMVDPRNFPNQGDNGEDTGDFIDADLPGKASLLFSSSTASNSEEEEEEEEEGYAGNLCDPTGSPLLAGEENNLSRDSHSPRSMENQCGSWEEDNGESFLVLPENNCSSSPRCGENVFPGASGQNCPSPKSDNVFLFGMCKSRLPRGDGKVPPPSEDQNNFPSPVLDNDSLLNSNNPSPGSDMVYFESGSNNCPSPGSDNVYLCGDENLCPDSDQLDMQSQSSESENEDFQPPLELLPLEGAMAAGEGASGGCPPTVVCYHGNNCMGGEASLFPRQGACSCYLDGTLDPCSSSSAWFPGSAYPSADWGVNNLSAGAWSPQQARLPPPYHHGPGSNFQNDASNTKQKNFNKFATPGCAQQPLQPEPSQELGLEDGEDLHSPSSPEMELYMLRGLTGAGSSEPVYEVIFPKGSEEGADTSAAAQSSLPNLPAIPSHSCSRLSEGGADYTYSGLPCRDVPSGSRHAEVEKVMRWNEIQAYVMQVKQIGTSACGPTAVLNVLKALDCSEEKDDVCSSIHTNLRLESAPIPQYLHSRAKAGTTAEDLLQGVERLTHGRVQGRFFHFWPPRQVELLKWLSHWMKKDAVPIMTMNQQKGVRPGSPVPDAWHHQMAYGVSSRGVYLTNPLEQVEEEVLMEQLTSDSVLLVRRQDVVSRFQDSIHLGELLQLNPDPRWRTMNVLGQVVNVLRESNMPHVPGYRAQLTSHVAIPAVYQAGITLYMRSDNPAWQELLQAPDLPELQLSDSDSDSDSDSS